MGFTSEDEVKNHESMYHGVTNVQNPQIVRSEETESNQLVHFRWEGDRFIPLTANGISNIAANPVMRSNKAEAALPLNLSYQQSVTVISRT